MLPGETIRSGARPTCVLCDTTFVLEVMNTPAGYYLGTRCRNSECANNFMPNSRETHYYPSLVEAQRDLAAGTGRWRS